jgi:integrase
VLDRWRAGLGPAPGEGAGHPKGSFGAVVDSYRASTHWREVLSARTREDYGEHLDALVGLWGPVPVVGLTRPVLVKYRETLAPGRQGNYRLQVLRIVLGHAYDEGEIPANPALGLKGFRLRARDSYWSDGDVARWLAKAPPPMRLALTLGLYTGQREGDVIRMRWSDLGDGPGGRPWLTIRQRKGKRLVSMPVAAPLLAELARAREEQKRTRRLGLVILLGERGAPYTEDGFRTQFWKVTAAAGMRGMGLAFMDARRTAVVNLAEAGCTVPEIASITRHGIAETQHILDTYWVATRPQAAAAIAKLERHRNRKSPRASPRAAGRPKLSD